jgi:hypothetical protein
MLIRNNSFDISEHFWVEDCSRILLVYFDQILKYLNAYPIKYITGKEENTQINENDLAY